MALWWLHGVYVFPVVVKPFQVTFCPKDQGQSPLKAMWILRGIFYPWSKVNDPSLNGR